MTSTDTPTREKTVTWEDPMATALAGRGAEGLDFLRSMIAGDVPGPPIASLLGMYMAAGHRSPALATIPWPALFAGFVGLAMLTQATESSPEWTLTMAATIIVVFPLLAAFVVFQRRFIQSFVQSGLK